MINTLNRLTTALADLVLFPLGWLPPNVALLICAALTGAAMTLVFRLTSNQSAIRRVAERTRAEMLAIWLFKDDLAASMRGQIMLLRLSALRIWLTAPSMLVMSVPLFFLFVQLDSRLAHRPLVPGETAVVQLQLHPKQWEQGQHATIIVPPSVRVESPPLRVPEDFSVYWRIRAISETSDPIQLKCGDAAAKKQFDVSEQAHRLQAVSQHRAGSGFLKRLLHPIEAGLSPAEPFRGITVDLPDRSIPLFGLKLPWWVVFFSASVVTTLFVKRWLKTEF